MRKGLSPLVVTFVLAVVLLVVVSGSLLLDPTTTHADALRTGGLAAGSVVALYALWLNDRRRKVEESRQEVERERYELERLRAERDRDRVTDERFAKSVELLGHDADQVRVGAMHALAGLARDRSEYTRTVLDVLCSYLRRPFDNPHLMDEEEKTDPEAERELQVRLTAQRLIVELLPATGTSDETFDLDLTGASLEYFDPSGRRIGTLTMRYAQLLSSTNFSGCEFTGPAWFTAAVCGSGRLSGHFRCQDANFHDRAWFSGTDFGSKTDFRGTRFGGEANFKNAVFHGDVSLRGASFLKLDLHATQFEHDADFRMAGRPKGVSLYNTMVNPWKRIDVPDFWTVETLPNGRARLTDPDS
ncbi:pentapeptide repeat-containing protein [Amycolatopsis sp.]|uniref:pentapeptide repeat-containing protein n=1 Tax=Amycolatopsis sp. TaxID=37632 RepID=UPI0039C87F7F